MNRLSNCCSTVADFIARLFSYSGRTLKSFDAMQILDKRLSHPHRSFRSIHIAGTNGKGSAAAKMAAALQIEGHKTALYTSPHISCFNERIRINGQMISNDRAEAILSRIFAASSDLALSFFDLLTALAFVYFAEEKVDFAVVETGLGGRLDATNVIHPILTVITSIGYDHTQLLGATLPEIAREKEGIVKPGIPLIAGPNAAPFYPYCLPAPPAETVFYDLENQSIAKTALIELQKQIPLSNTSIEKGILIRPRCRFEIKGGLILDVAHNPDAFERLAQALAFHFPGKKFPFYMAFSADKNWKKCVETILPLSEGGVAGLHWLKGDYPRLLSPQILQDQYPGSKIIDPKEVKSGVVCGSFYIISEFV